MDAHGYRQTRIVIYPRNPRGNVQKCNQILTGLLHDIIGQGPFDEAADINAIRASIVAMTRSGLIEFRTNSVIRRIFCSLVQEPPPAYFDLALFHGYRVDLVDPRSPSMSRGTLSSVICSFSNPNISPGRPSRQIERTSRSTSLLHRQVDISHFPGIRSYSVQREEISEGNQSFRVSLDMEPPQSLRLERVRALRRNLQQPNCLVFKLTFE